jgi:hypothetical protein
MSESKITNDEILGTGRTITPRSVPFGYQIEHWERSADAFNEELKRKPTTDHDSFMSGWNAAFCEIYGPKK